ncbi:MAG: sigma-70 family RNA polymerase sigma factor [Bacteroidia bacterium]|nr:sigma-70 family RNA polymerase sigma factor [Bacteroidia bacterium]MCZ2276452.1 sigma-70 family RNA polymerase sigma factor [Bacteroidia bacterium]
MRQLRITKLVTNRDTASLDKYLNEIGKLPLITAEEEIVLAKRIKQGDHEALEKLTNANLRFVVSVAKQYQNQGLTLGDLINEGNLGLIKGAQRFDESRGFKFISYAVWWIRQSILQALAEQSRIIRLPLNKIGYINKINRLFNQLEQDFEREPTNEELAQALEISPSDVIDTLSYASKPLSVDAPMGTEEDGTLLDFIQGEDNQSPDNQMISESLKREISRALDTLSPREAEVIRMYYGLGEGRLPLTLEEIGEQMELTRERVRQIKEKAIRRLKHKSCSKILRTYLG